MRISKATSAARPVALAAMLLAALVVAVSGCGGPKDVAQERALRAEAADELLIGAAWPWASRGEGMYWNGMKMAVDEINAYGGVLGRPLRVIKEDDKESVNEGRLVAQRLSDNPDVVAVVGHLNSHVSIPAAAMYEAAGLLMITPASTSPELTRKGFRRVFRSVNSDEKIGGQMVEFALATGYRRVIICYVRNAYGLGLANAFEQHADAAGLQIVDRQSYDPAVAETPSSFARMIREWKNHEFDAIFLAGMAPQAGYVVKHVRAAGIKAPIFGGDALDTAELLSSAGTDAEGVVVASIFHPDNPRPEVQRFNDRFKATYGVLPDSWAARGYEAIQLLAAAMERAGSPAPDRVAEALRSIDTWTGITGSFSFDEKGDVIGKTMVTVVVRDGRFQFLEENQLASAAQRALQNVSLDR